jgi:muramoyltetrapeptide carboxypeptidase
MNRKKFITSLSVASIGATVFNRISFPKSLLRDDSSLIRPPRLRVGDRIALVTPGSYISEEELQDSVKNLSDLGFEITFSKRLMLQNGYFAGTDQERAEDLMEMFERDDVKGIVCARGGYGCIRILPLLKYDVIRKNPKVLIGYSDVTALLYGIYERAGLITFHGPVATSTFNDYSVNNFKKVLMYPNHTTLFENSTSGDDENIYGVNTIVKGKRKGSLVGGNLSIMVSLIGTKYDVNYSGKIIFIEEVGEEPYRIDRMFTQMIEAGKFKHTTGIMMGIFKDCEQKKENPSFDKSFSLMDVLKDRLGDLKIPVIYGMSFGHVKDKFTIPFGVLAELDTENQTLTLLEKAVR